MNLKRELKAVMLQRPTLREIKADESQKRIESHVRFDYFPNPYADESQKRIENFSIEEPETKKKKFDESQKRIERKLLLATPEFQLCSR